jgi:hypothetical protein
MVKYIKKVFLYKTLTCAIVLILVLNSKAQQTNFSGVWKLNLDKSDFGNVPSKAATQFYQIEQGKQEITLKWTTKNNANEDVESSQRLLLDSTAASALLPSQRTRVMAAKFSVDGKSLLISKSYSKANNPNDNDYVLKETWRLINGGKELLVELNSPVYTIKAIYEHPGLSIEMKE